jgi:hypothetical protein
VFWAGRAPLKIESPPRFNLLPMEDFSEEIIDDTPERRYPNYVEISPGVRSSPWRDDLAKRKAIELKDQ